MDFKKKKKKEPDVLPSIIDLTAYIDDDIMETDILGSYTGVPYQMDDDQYEMPTQDADDL